MIQRLNTNDSCERNVETTAGSDTCHLGQPSSASLGIQALWGQFCAYNNKQIQVQENSVCLPHVEFDYPRDVSGWQYMYMYINTCTSTWIKPLNWRPSCKKGVNQFSENEAQINQDDYGTMLFMSKQVSLPEISSILQNWPKTNIHPFYAKAFNIIINTAIITVALERLLQWGYFCREHNIFLYNLLLTTRMRTLHINKRI